MCGTKAPHKKKVKAEGETKFPYENFWKVYGVMLKKLELCEKLVICTFVLDTYSLEVFEKGKLKRKFKDSFKFFDRARS